MEIVRTSGRFFCGGLVESETVFLYPLTEESYAWKKSKITDYQTPVFPPADRYGQRNRYQQVPVFLALAGMTVRCGRVILQR